MAELPSRLHAAPADVDRWLRERFAEDVLLRYQQAIGNRAVAEAAQDVRDWVDGIDIPASPLPTLAVEGWQGAADHIDPAKDGGPYPSVLLCSKHGGGEFGPCPGAPWCTPRIDDVETGDGR